MTDTATAEAPARSRIARTEANSVALRLAKAWGVDPHEMVATLKATAFKQRSFEGKPKEISNEQFQALLLVSEAHKLNPFLKEIFAFDDGRGGIVPVVGVDGWSNIVNSRPQLDGIEFNYGPEIPSNGEHGVACEWIECLIHRTDRTRPTVIREYFSECYQPPRGQNRTKGAWQSHPRRFLRHKALIQCARVAFSLGGIYDEDEAGRILDGPIDITPASTRGAPPVMGAEALSEIAGVKRPGADDKSGQIIEGEILDRDVPPELRDVDGDDIPGLE